MDTLISSFMHIAAAYSTPLGVITGLIACDCLSRVLNRAQNHSPEAIEVPAFECPHGSDCCGGASFGGQCCQV